MINNAMIIEPENEYYFVVEGRYDYEVERETTPCPEDILEKIAPYFNSLLDKLTEEERKFLLHECVMNDSILRNKMYEAELFKREPIYNQVKVMSDEKIREFCLVIKFTKSFNYYLRYMLSEDWVLDNFESEEERKQFVF